MCQSFLKKVLPGRREQTSSNKMSPLRRRSCLLANSLWLCTLSRGFRNYSVFLHFRAAKISLSFFLLLPSPATFSSISLCERHCLFATCSTSDLYSSKYFLMFSLGSDTPSPSPSPSPQLAKTKMVFLKCWPRMLPAHSSLCMHPGRRLSWRWAVGKRRSCVERGRQRRVGSYCVQSWRVSLKLRPRSVRWGYLRRRRRCPARTCGVISNSSSIFHHINQKQKYLLWHGAKLKYFSYVYMQAYSISDRLKNLISAGQSVNSFVYNTCDSLHLASSVANSDSAKLQCSCSTVFSFNPEYLANYTISSSLWNASSNTTASSFGFSLHSGK